MINEASMKKGEKIIKQKKLYPGYVFIKSKMNDKIWYVIRNTPGIRLIVGADTHPIPVTEAEYQRMVQQIEQSKERSSMNIPYKTGDLVVLKAGDFKDMK
jgi:transcriptional antiterminator NusG